MNSLSNVLVQDHQACDEIFAETEQAVERADFDLARATYGRFHEAMERHMSVEEKILFPKFEDKVGERAGPTEVMRREHEMMRDLLTKMAAALEQQQASQYLGLSETLLVLLQQHNVKEESILYPMIEQVLTPERDSVIADLRANGIG